MMVALTGVVAFAASIYSTSRWDRAGVHFHPLLQLQLMGLNGAFLTGDLFNLFVFFEVMLAASYGLLLHGSGRLRVQAGLHYIAINLAASSLFLVGAALLYGVTGTLNMADLGVRIAQLAPADRGLVHAGRRHPRDRLLRQGRRLAAQLLAGAGLQRRRCRRWARCSRC